MKELVEYIVKQIVSMPDQVVVEESVSGSEVNLSLKVADEDMGIVIGKKGQTIRSIRKLLGVRAMNDGVRVNLSLVDAKRSVDDSQETTDEEVADKSVNNEVAAEVQPGESVPKKGS